MVPSLVGTSVRRACSRGTGRLGRRADLIKEDQPKAIAGLRGVCCAGSTKRGLAGTILFVLVSHTHTQCGTVVASHTLEYISA